MSALPNVAQYTVAWIAPLAHELAAATALLDELYDEAPSDFVKNPNDPNAYTWGQMSKHHVVLASLPVGEYGTNVAAVVATSMLASLPSIKFGLVVGIGAGIPNEREDYDIRLGDVVVCQPQGISGGVIQYDLAKAKEGTLKRTGTLNMPPAVLRTALGKLQARHDLKPSIMPQLLSEMVKKYPQMAKSTKSKPGYVHQGVDKDIYYVGTSAAETVQQREPRETLDPRIHYGTIASGNLLVKDADARDSILGMLEGPEDVICLDMEAAGLMNNFPCLVVRGICDYADHHKNDLWQRYAAATAAAFAKEFLTYVDTSEIKNTTSIGELGRLLDEVKHDLATVRVAQDASLGAIRDMQSEDQWSKLVERLSPPDPSSNHFKGLKERHAETGRWFLDSEAFTDWKKRGTHTALWLNGLPGAGKSVLCSTIIENLLQTLRGPECAVAYFYFDFSDNRKQNLDAAARSLLYQLAEQHHETRRTLETLAKETMSTAILCHALETVFDKLGDVVIILDALDEATPRGELLGWLSGIIGNDGRRNTRWLLTSRKEDDIQRFLKGLTRAVPLETKTVDSDVRSYVVSRLHTDKVFVERWQRQHDVLELIATKLMEKSGGMFRWAACQLDQLADCLTLGELKKALDSLPKTLYDTYSRILAKIPESRKAGAVRLLQLLMLSPIPIAIDEAATLLAINIDKDPIFEPDHVLANPQELEMYCPGFFAIAKKEYVGRWVLDNARTFIQLTHSSVKEYLLAGELNKQYVSGLARESAAATLTKLSLRCLKANRINPRSQSGDGEYPKWTWYPEWALGVAEYAAQSWTIFARIAEAQDEVRDKIVDFLVDVRYPLPPKTISQVIADEDPYPVTTATRGGLIRTLKSLLHLGHPIDKDMGLLEKCLDRACADGNREIVQLLLEYSANVDGLEHCHPLASAARSGHLDIVQLLLERGASIDKGFPLHEASYWGRLDVAKHLLVRGANVHLRTFRDYDHVWYIQCRKMTTPLHLACIAQRSVLIKDLVSHGADIEVENDRPLAIALAHRTNAFALRARTDSLKALATVATLLDCRSTVHACDIRNVVKAGDCETMKLLLNHQTQWHSAVYLDPLLAAACTVLHEDSYIQDGSATDTDEGTCAFMLIYVRQKPDSFFQAFCDWPDDLVLSILLPSLDRGSVLWTTNERSTILHLASTHRLGVSIAKHAIKLGAPIDAENDEGLTPLWTACFHGNRELAKLLVEAGADVNGQSRNGPHRGVHLDREDHQRAFMMLIEFGADVNLQDEDGRTVLHVFCLHSYDLDKAKLWLDAGADVNQQDKHGQTPLHHACQNFVPPHHGRYSFLDLNAVKGLIEAGADVNKQDLDGKTPLHNACYKMRSLDVVKMLVKASADVNKQDFDGKTPLHNACYGRGSVIGVKVLVEAGADVNKQDFYGKTPLHEACSCSRDLDIVRVLFEAGADINKQDFDGETPLYTACLYSWDFDLVKMLVEAGADMDRKDNLGRSLLAIIKSGEVSEYWHVWDGKEIMSFLEDCEARTTDKHQSTQGPSSSPRIIEIMDDEEDDDHVKSREENPPASGS